jgi:hypothetical protein
VADDSRRRREFRARREVHPGASQEVEALGLVMHSTRQLPSRCCWRAASSAARVFLRAGNNLIALCRLRLRPPRVELGTCGLEVQPPCFQQTPIFKAFSHLSPDTATTFDAPEFAEFVRVCPRVWVEKVHSCEFTKAATSKKPTV